MLTAKQLIDAKGHQVFTVRPTQSVYEAISLMAEKNVGSLLVMKEKQAGRHHHRAALRQKHHPQRKGLAQTRSSARS